MIDSKTVLTGTQKVAVVLMTMDQQRASEVMKQFSESEAADIIAEIVQLRRVDAAVMDSAVAEFHDLTTVGGRNPRGGHAVAIGLLEKSFGAERAAGMLASLAPDIRGQVELAQAGYRAGLPFNLDSWDGYPPARERLYASFRNAKSSPIVLSGRRTLARMTSTKASLIRPSS